MKSLLGVLVFWCAVAVLLFCANGTVCAQIPATCAQYEVTLVRAVVERMGPGSPVALFAGQMMQESSCNSQAKSSAGALGLTQFMPDTASWIATIDNSLQPAEPLNPQWAIRAQVAYMFWLSKRTHGLTECDTYAFALSSYNGGEGWLHRDQRAAQAAGANPAIWFGSVDIHPDRKRNPGMIAENRGYPQRILFKLQPQFVAAAWGRGVNCIADEEIIYEHQISWWTRAGALIERLSSFFAMGT
jgi:hypothetical protein